MPVGAIASTGNGCSHIDVVDVGGCWCLLTPVVEVTVVVVMVHCSRWKDVENESSSKFRV
jgi:hypothetical protein